MRGLSSGRRGVSIAAAVGVVVLLSACTTATPDQDPAPTSSTSSSGSVAATPSASATPVALDPLGSARDNLDYFESVMKPFFDANPNAKGKAIINHLATAGFSKDRMEVTPDKTAVGLDADNIEFSVKINKTCLVGQTGIVKFQAFAAPLLASNTCLIGKTRAIDW